jgi:hypothetical protein
MKAVTFKNILKKYEIRNILQSFVFSVLTLILIAGIKVINPRNVGWLSVGDGTGEISWEFFRKQPIFQFPFGLNPKYGLEISSTAVLDGQIPLFSFIFHPISNLLPERFQYIGIFMLINFALNFYFAKRIFLFLKFNEYQSIISASILASSPVILNRVVENTHYSFTSAWVIFAAIYLVLSGNLNFGKWIILFMFSVLNHLYYIPFLFILFLVALSLPNKHKILRIKGLLNLASLLLVSGLLMYISGFFYGGSSSKDVGYGLFRSTLLSPIDPSGWSSFIPDLNQPDGSYEGFAYIGLPAIIFILIYLVLIGRRNINNSSLNFTPLWTSAIMLFIFALSNKIAFGPYELFTFRIPEFISIIPDTFRSTGRFSWLLAFLFFIYFSYKVSLKISQKSFSIILTVIFIFGFVDYLPQINSSKNNKFRIQYETSLKDKSWESISECYKNIRVYPPTVGVVNYYDFVNIAMEQSLGINTGRFGRVDQNAILGAYDLMHEEFNTGIYRTDSFYVFTNADFVLPEIVNYHKNLAIHTLNKDSAYGELDGYTFLAPALKNCKNGRALKAAAKGFGAPEAQKYRGEKLFFGKNLDTSKYILIGFSALEDWGVWSVDEMSKINFNTDDLSKFNSININAQDYASPANEFSVSLNDSKIGTCYFSTEFSTCSLPFNFKSLKTNIITLSFVPKIIRSPKDLGLSDDTRNLGFGMNSISFS